MQPDDAPAAGESLMVPYALAYARRGWPVFPVRGKVPDGRLVANGLNDATTDSATIHHWWRVAPEDGVGIRTGNGLLVVDVDVKHDGDNTLEQVEAQHGEFPETIEVMTGGGGVHLYLSVDGETRNTAGKIGPGIDTRGDGGYVVAPPSPHPSGRRYEFRPGHSPKDTDPAAAPEWLFGLLIRPRSNGATVPARALDDLISDGQRNSTLASLAGTMRRRGMEGPEILAAIRETNLRRCTPPLDDSEVAAIAASVCRYAPTAPAIPARPQPDVDRPLPRMVVQWAIDVRPKPVAWLWRPRMALGTISLLAGVPGLGKSLLTCYLAAAVTRGWLESLAPSRALICTAEDSFDHVVVPRLVAAGADMSMVGLVAMERDGLTGSPVLPEDIGALGLKILEHQVRLLVIDPLMAHLSPDLDSHRDQSVRTALAPLHHIAEAYQCAILLVSHLNKRPETDLFSRVGGSIGLSGAARNVLLMTPDPDAEEDAAARVLVHGKGNLGQLAPTLRMRVRGSDAVAAEDGSPIATALIELGEDAPHLQVADVLKPRQSEDERSEIHDAMDFLTQALEDGPRPSKDVTREAEQLGHTRHTLMRARKRLGVTAKKLGNSGGWVMEISPKNSTRREPGAPFEESKGSGPELRSGTGPNPLAPFEEFQSKNSTGEAFFEKEKNESGDTCAAGCGRAVGRPGIRCARCQLEGRSSMPTTTPSTADAT